MSELLYIHGYTNGGERVTVSITVQALRRALGLDEVPIMEPPLAPVTASCSCGYRSSRPVSPQELKQLDEIHPFGPVLS